MREKSLDECRRDAGPQNYGHCGRGAGEGGEYFGFLCEEHYKAGRCLKRERGEECGAQVCRGVCGEIFVGVFFEI